MKAAVTSTTGTPGLTIGTAAIIAGKLVIVGTASSPGIEVEIDGTSFKATANSKKLFGFNVDYRTPDCRLTLTTNTGSLQLMIGMCGPQGEQGPQGIMGPTGPQGPQGELGPQGAGRSGRTRPAGRAGRSGRTRPAG